MPSASRWIRPLAMTAGAFLAACRGPVTGVVPAEHKVPYSVVPNPSTIDVSAADSFLVTPRTIVYASRECPASIGCAERGTR